MARASGLSKHIKYTLDRVFALVLLIVTAPLLVLIAVAICLDSRGNPLFLQERVGENGVPFTILKFRTMVTGSERDGLGVTTAADDARITRIGALLRAIGLDELPQLVNILRGEMSFVGPRPTLRYQVDAYTQQQARRLLFRPGVSGWAQVHGRNTLAWNVRIEHDLFYVDNYSLWLDVKTLWRTVWVVLKRQGVYASDGSNDDFVSAGPGSDPSGAHGEIDETQVGADTLSRCQPSLSDADTAENAVVVIGAGGHACVVVDAIRADGRYTVAGIIDDAVHQPDTPLLGYPILGTRAALGRIGVPRRAVVAIGSPTAREEFTQFLVNLGFELPVIIHPSAQVGSDVRIGAGTVLLAGTVVNARAILGDGVIVNTGASIDHDCRVGDFSHVAPGARLAGNVSIGCRTHIGIGASVIQSLEIGDDVVVGAGAAVVRSLDSGVTAAGVPARPIRRFEPARTR